MYAEALEAMTNSRDLYREAAEQAHAALAAYWESADTVPESRPDTPASPAASPLQQLTRTFERFKGSTRTRRPAAGSGDAHEDKAVEEQPEIPGRRRA